MATVELRAQRPAPEAAARVHPWRRRPRHQRLVRRRRLRPYLARCRGHLGAAAAFLLKSRFAETGWGRGDPPGDFNHPPYQVGKSTGASESG